MQDQSSSGSGSQIVPDDNALAENLRKRMQRAGRQVLGDADQANSHQFIFRTGHDAHKHPSNVVLTEAADPVPAWDKTPLLDVAGYKSPMLLAQMMVVMLALQAGYFAFSMLVRLSLVNSTVVSATEWGPLQIFLFTLTAAAFVAWTYRLYRNLDHLGAAGLSTTPVRASALVAFPIVNLISPPIILREVWGATNPHLDCRLDGWRKTDIDSIIPTWWATFVIAIALRVASNLEPSVAGNMAVNIVASVAFTLSAALGIVAVWRISIRQDDKQLLVRAGVEEE